jgi:hypothetical protein
MDSRDALLVAVNELIRSEDARQKLDAVEAILPAARRYSAVLTGELAIMNPLVELAVKQSDKFEKVLDLVDDKRAAAGLLPLRTKGDQFDKNAYMKEFMVQKRARERRAADIENMMRPERDRLIGRARTDFMQRQAARWKEERDALLERARSNYDSGRIPREELDLLLKQFWENVDKQLDDLEDLAKQERSAGRGVKGGASLAALNAVLAEDPYKK